MLSALEKYKNDSIPEDFRQKMIDSARTFAINYIQNYNVNNRPSKIISASKKEIDKALQENVTVGLELYKEVPRWSGSQEEITGYALDLHKVGEGES